MTKDEIIAYIVEAACHWGAAGGQLPPEHPLYWLVDLVADRCTNGEKPPFIGEDFPGYDHVCFD